MLTAIGFGQLKIVLIRAGLRNSGPSPGLVAMKCLFYVTFALIVECTTIGKTVKVPDSDPTLQELIYRSALAKSNQQIRDRVWWVPSGGNYQATKVTVLKAGKLYSTYDFQMSLQKSPCDFQHCHVILAWTERDWSSIEMENYCSK
ncbi:unnamed protein product [Heligmosomoides polygyrus]|uniref:Cystatin domain-containing protein n=1 Tax=Heligmosomoides polygyrus TaxID=6339 RepID=A0A183GDW0_HELPZ|nr:unnamed protein product [Heligmosomoides polygyrus]